MTLKQKRQLKRDFMPTYYKNFNVWGSIFLCVFLVVGFAVCIAVGMVFDESPVTYITMIVFAVAAIVVSIICIVFVVKMQKKLLAQRTQEIESEFIDLPFDEVTAALLEKRVITEYGFLANIDGYAGVLVLPFKDAIVSVYSANIYTKVCSVAVITDLNGGLIAEYILDNELFNFICKKGVNLNFVGNSRLLVNDKAAFVKVHIKGSSERNTWGVLFGAIGMLISDESSGVNFSRKTVLNILGKKMQ